MSAASTTSPGDRSAAEIEREVERSRARLTGTVEELKDRVSPGQMAEQAMDWLRGSGGRAFLGNMGAAVRDNPMPVLLVAAGIGWLAMAGGRDTSRDNGRYNGRDTARHPAGIAGTTEDQAVLTAAYPRPTDAEPEGSGSFGGGAGETLGARAGETLSARAGQALGAATEAGRSAVARTGEAVQGAGEALRDLGQRATRSGGAAAESIAEVLERQPLLLGALGLAVGAAVGALLPKSAAENRLMGEARDRVADRAGEAWEDAREKLAEHGLSPERGAAALGEVARDLRETVQDATGGRREEGPRPGTPNATGMPPSQSGPGSGGPV